MKSNNKNEKMNKSKATYENNLKAKYYKETVPHFQKEFKVKSKMAVPKIERIVVNCGIGRFKENKEMMENILRDITRITGQKAVFTKSRKAISGFKIKQNENVGIKVTLRGRIMYDFLERMIVSALPRVRDFRGIGRNNFGRKGNVNVGIKEHVVFPEIDNENTNYIFSLQVNIVNTARNQKEGMDLMKTFGFPIEKEEE